MKAKTKTIQMKVKQHERMITIPSHYIQYIGNHQYDKENVDCYWRLSRVDEIFYKLFMRTTRLH